MEWTAGYASGVEYVAGFYREQSPAYLNFVCVLNGYEPVPIDRPFTYFELGFGRGLTVNVQAAANPQGRFYAADFNPAHVCGAQQLADAAKLGNLTLLENSFAELAAGEVAGLPQFDFITLHGIYTWVSRENRAHVRQFIKRYLKPGGIVFVSYNAMPGWAQSQPLQRLLREHAALHPARTDAQIEQARGFFGKMVEAKAGYFVRNPNVEPRLQVLKTGSPQYLVHEYLNEHWEPLYHADVARELGEEAKLEYAGSAELPLAFQAVYLSQDKQDLLKSINDATVRETVKDYMLDTTFRKDVFVRGARTMRQQRYLEAMFQFGLALTVPRGQITMKMKLPFGEVNAREEVYQPVLDALAQRPCPLSELGALPALQGKPLSQLVQMVALLTATGQACIYPLHQPGPTAGSAAAMNRALTAQLPYGDDYQVLVSPLLGNGITVSTVMSLVYLMLATPGTPNDAAAIAARAWRIMAAQGRKLLRDGKPIEGDEQNLAELTIQIGEILSKNLPVWRQLGML
ncbi:MAG: methyltransferase regulatory domain-containing protein [Burkholderiaceae bacterium]|nr:methyltransferase regulatory domain-containing protein [Burkholderiaceae bacterium]